MYGDKEERGEQREGELDGTLWTVLECWHLKESLGTDQSSGRKERHIPLG